MNVQRPTEGDIGQVREDFIPKTDYYSKEFAELENERLWPRVWQMACREQDLRKVGDFYTYDIVDDSIIVVRTSPTEIKAFHNVCSHRGRRLTKGCGHAKRFHCRFHGWQFGLDGEPLEVVDRDDWGELLKDEDIALMPVKVGQWGGWVYINMDLECESLESFLEPAKSVIDPLDMAGLSYHWMKSAIVPSNWKTVLGLFNEAYHLQQTHRQMLRYWDDYTVSFARGRHGNFRYEDTLPPGLPSQRLGQSIDDVDFRAGIADYIEDMRETLGATELVLMGNAASRLMSEVPADTPHAEILGKLMEFSASDLAGQGIKSPQLTAEQIKELGSDWHLFPNHILIAGPNGCLAYRARPNGHDPDTAIFDVYSLLRYAPGEEPKVTPEWSDDLTDAECWPKILRQDYENLEEIQKGLKSRGFRGARPSPKQELPVSNFHRTLREFMGV